ncbi:hypothetical protein RUM43_010943 [Polyplax serrata]|uniref:Uncharacterized protein n=1 Tax=Polyplax serrata TaxID=468196 RepID=A0AAN8P494_POLSC
MTGSSAAKEYMKLMDIIEQDQMTSENSNSKTKTTKGSQTTSKSGRMKPENNNASTGKIPIPTQSLKREEKNKNHEKMVIEDQHMDLSERSLHSSSSIPASLSSTKDKFVDLIEKNSSTSSLRLNFLKFITSDPSLSGSLDGFAPEGKTSLQRLREARELRKIFKELDEKAEDENEKIRQDKVVSNLYDVIQKTSSVLFNKTGKDEMESFWTTDDKNCQSLAKCKTPQSIYDRALQDMITIWSDAVNIIRTVKNRALTYVLQKGSPADRDLLALETEMLQLAITYAASYSKWKSESLVRHMQKQLQIKELNKSELELFLDSKLFGEYYNDEDMEIMATAVHELNLGV